MRITAELQATGGNTTGFKLTEAFVGELGGGGRPKVVVTMRGYEFRSSIARMGGDYWLGVSAARRADAGVRAGDQIDLEIVLDTRERTVDVPEELAVALAAEPAAKAKWDTLSFSQQRLHAESVAGAKAADTRTRRVAKVVEKLLEG